MSSGIRSALEQVVRPVSSSNFALGKRAVTEWTFIDSVSPRRWDANGLTVFQGRHNREESSIHWVAVVVNAGDVNVQNPCCLALLNAEGSRWYHLGSANDIRRQPSVIMIVQSVHML